MNTINNINYYSENNQRDKVLGILQNNDLSYEMLNTSETAFKLGIIEKSKKHNFLFKTWQKISNSGVINFDKLKIDKNSRVSYTSNSQGQMNIGGQKLPLNAKDQMIFLDNTFNYEQEILRKFSHELSHVVTYTLRNDQIVNKFFNNIIVKMRQNGKGLSLIGSMDFYKNRGGVSEQSKEDITDLTNMCLLGSNYLKKRLNFLINADDDFLNKYKVQRLNSESAKYIYDNIEYIVLTFMNI